MCMCVYACVCMYTCCTCPLESTKKAAIERGRLALTDSEEMMTCRMYVCMYVHVHVHVDVDACVLGAMYVYDRPACTHVNIHVHVMHVSRPRYSPSGSRGRGTGRHAPYVHA